MFLVSISVYTPPYIFYITFDILVVFKQLHFTLAKRRFVFFFNSYAALILCSFW